MSEREPGRFTDFDQTDRADPVSDPYRPELDETERRVRRALGLSGAVGPAPAQEKRQPATRSAPDRTRRRWARDGEVPVVVVSRADPAAGGGAGTVTPAASRLQDAETAIQAERTARERAERALEDARQTVRDLQTQLAHVMLARDEAVAAAQRAEEARLRAEAALRPIADAVAPARRARKAAAKPASPVREAAPRKRREAEPKPVKWWVKPRRAKG